MVNLDDFYVLCKKNYEIVFEYYIYDLLMYNVIGYGFFFELLIRWI